MSTAKRLTVIETRQQFSEVLSTIEYGRGGRVVVQRRGKDVAAIVPMPDLERLEALGDTTPAPALGGLTELEKVVGRLAIRREARAAARKAWVNVATAAGSCTGPRDESPCYSQPAVDVGEWCESCRMREPAWKAYRAAAFASAAATRAVMVYARKLKAATAAADFDRLEALAAGAGPES